MKLDSGFHKWAFSRGMNVTITNGEYWNGETKMLFECWRAAQENAQLRTAAPPVAVPDPDDWTRDEDGNRVRYSELLEPALPDAGGALTWHKFSMVYDDDKHGWVITSGDKPIQETNTVYLLTDGKGNYATAVYAAHLNSWFNFRYDFGDKRFDYSDGEVETKTVYWTEFDKLFSGAAAPRTDAALADARDALAEVQLQIERMAQAAIPHSNAAGYGSDGGDFIEAYTFKTGAFHTLLGMVRGGKVSTALAALSALPPQAREAGGGE